MNYAALLKWLGDNSALTGVTLLGIVTGFWQLLKFLYQRIQAYKDSKNLQPYYTSDTIEEAKRRYIRTKCQNIDPANEENYRASHAFSTKEDLLSFFLKRVFTLRDNENKFYLILADSGMGKSTFMLNLFSRYNAIFIIFYKKRAMKLLPLGESSETITAEIQAIQNPGKTILLLDGFDEIPTSNSADIKSKFDEIIELVKGFSIVIITCRTHFFSSEKDEPFELRVKRFNTKGNGYHSVKKLYISPFDTQDIKNYVNKTFSWLDFKHKKSAFKIIENTHDLMVRPMLLSYISDIVNARRKRFNNSFEIYESLINSWLDRESNKYQSIKKREFKLNLTYFTYAVVNYIYDNYESNGMYIPLEEATRISVDFQIDLNEIEIKSRSLLNRNSNGDYKFSHKSIYEFFLAYLAYVERLYDGNKYTLKYDLTSYDVAKTFISDIICFGKTEFKLPDVNDAVIGYNIPLYQEIIRERNDGANAKVLWIGKNTFIIVKTTQGDGLISEI